MYTIIMFVAIVVKFFANEFDRDLFRIWYVTDSGSLSTAPGLRDSVAGGATVFECGGDPQGTACANACRSIYFNYVLANLRRQRS